MKYRIVKAVNSFDYINRKFNYYPEYQKSFFYFWNRWVKFDFNDCNSRGIFQFYVMFGSIEEAEAFIRNYNSLKSNEKNICADVVVAEINYEQ